MLRPQTRLSATKSIAIAAFQQCPKLEDVQLASSSISFGPYPFYACDRLIELASAAGFPSDGVDSLGLKMAQGVVPCLIA